MGGIGAAQGRGSIYFVSNAISGSMMLDLRQRTLAHGRMQAHRCRVPVCSLSAGAGTGTKNISPVGVGDEAVADHLVYDEVRFFKVVPAREA